MLHGLSNSALMLADFQGFLGGLWSFILLALGFSLVIFVHELGHFLAAKWAGVRVERFAIGFGKELLGFTKGETRYSLNVLPLGGYVKMLGQEDFVVDKSGELKVKEDPTSFTSKSVGKRMVIVSAGVIMNLLFAAIAFTIVAMVGKYERPPIVSKVEENTPAGRAGLLPGDVIEEINGTHVDDFTHLSSLIMLSDPDQELVMKIRREGKIVEPFPKVLPEYVVNQQVRQIGVAPPQTRRVMIPPYLESKAEPGDHKLHFNDELYKIFVDGKFEVINDPTAFFRAAIAARGGTIRAIVKRPLDPDNLNEDQAMATDAEVPSKEVEVEFSSTWIPLPHDPASELSASLLGLVPRITIMPEEKKSIASAGAQPGDVINKIDSLLYPNQAELKQTIESNPDQTVPMEVCRRGVENNGLSKAIVDFCVKHREEFIATALGNITVDQNKTPKTFDIEHLSTAVEQTAKTEGLSDADAKTLQDRLHALRTSDEWRQWFERVDIHKLDEFTPKRPFALFQKLAPTIDAQLLCLDEAHLVVADIVPKFGDRTTAAARSGIPRGAVILAVNDAPVKRWYELSRAFEKNAGKTVKIKYRLGSEYRSAEMQIPDCVQSKLALGPGDRIVKIDGRSSCRLANARGTEVEVALPDFLAIEAMLKANAGKTVPVEYITASGERKTAQYAVTTENYDPWMDRVAYRTSFFCYPLFERHPIHNPFKAFVAGTTQAYRATANTVQSIRHMLITREVGMSKVSGPVGIIRAGTMVADSGVLNLLWFLGLISANLAVINFLPMPIVDGGLFLFLILEKVRGEPVSIKTQVATQLIGIALIATLFILVTYNDIKNWILGA